VNRLADETSPYLRQHRDNPVHWYPWGPEAFAAAKERNAPILLSVGYSSCHWCHVMAHESFEDPGIASAMNRLFVNVKVDREERPDVDALYMEAVQRITGRGGWPMTVFLTPDGAPFYGGTYFPPDQFQQLMSTIDDVWRNRPDDVQQNVDGLTSELQRATTMTPADDMPGLEAVDAGLEDLVRNFDPEWGGFGGAPKFPSAMALEFLARAVQRGAGDVAQEMLTTSLDSMASGGIYDHLGGGFARYSVDAEWLVPHFEKMLYDQALLVRVYAHTASLLEATRYLQVVDETIGYVLRDLRHPDGGFYSSQDADSADADGHAHEGLFYTWTEDEVRAVLGDDADAAMEWYEFAYGGNFEGRTILSRSIHRSELVRSDDIESIRQRLFAARELRPRPGTDDKVLTEWNALMCSALCEAAALFDRDDWAEAAVANGEFLLRELRGADGRWFRSWHATGTPKARHAALAADHAHLVDAFTRLAELTGQRRWIAEARAVADTMLDHFWDTDNGGLYTIPDDGEALIVRQKDLLDNATPSANSAGAWALYRLAALTGEVRYRHHADQILRLLGPLMPQAPSAFANSLTAVAAVTQGMSEILVTGDRPDLLAFLRHLWMPDAVLAWGEPYDSPLWADRPDGFAYLCQNHVCALPLSSVESLDGLML